MIASNSFGEQNESVPDRRLRVRIIRLSYGRHVSQSAKQYSLRPVIDLINHSSKVSSEVTYDYWSDSFSVTSTQSYRKGEQVHINYSQSNDILLQFYGFIEPNNEKDVYVMSSLLKHLQSDADVNVEPFRLDDLNSSSLLSALQTVNVARNGVPVDTLQALQYLVASEAKGGPASFSSSGNPELEERVAGALA